MLKKKKKKTVVCWTLQMWTCTWLSGSHRLWKSPSFSTSLLFLWWTEHINPEGEFYKTAWRFADFTCVCLLNCLKTNQHLHCILTLYRIQIFFVCMCASQMLLFPLFIKIVIALEPGAEGPRCLRATVAFLLGNRIIFLSVANYNRGSVSFKREALCNSNFLL